MSKAPQHFETARTNAARISEVDIDDLVRMNRDERVMATLGGVRSENETCEALARMLEHWERHGYGVWGFRAHATGSFVGRAGLRNSRVEGVDEIELLYAVMPELWLSGYASEMARALLEIAREIEIKSVVAFTLPTNLGSRRVMENAGMRYQRDITWAGLPHVLYRIEFK